jgi:hypothetical protein
VKELSSRCCANLAIASRVNQGSLFLLYIILTFYVNIAMVLEVQKSGLDKKCFLLYTLYRKTTMNGRLRLWRSFKSR